METDALAFMSMRSGALEGGDLETRAAYLRRRAQGFCEGCGDPAPVAAVPDGDAGAAHGHLLAEPVLCDSCHREESRRIEARTRIQGVERALDRGRLRLVAAAILFDAQGRLFLARRGPKTFLAGFWEFPGGKADPGESLAACLVRELREELDCVPERIEPLAMVDHPYPEVDLWIRMVGFTGIADPASIRPIEHDAVVWVRQHELAAYELAPADIPLARRIVARIAR